MEEKKLFVANDWEIDKILAIMAIIDEYIRFREICWNIMTYERQLTKSRTHLMNIWIVTGKLSLISDQIAYFSVIVSNFEAEIFSCRFAKRKWKAQPM